MSGASVERGWRAGAGSQLRCAVSECLERSAYECPGWCAWWFSVRVLEWDTVPPGDGAFRNAQAGCGRVVNSHDRHPSAREARCLSGTS